MLSPLQRSLVSPTTVRRLATFPKEPVNAERGHSRSAFYLALAIPACFVAYMAAGSQIFPNLPSMQAMDHATTPKTAAAKEEQRRSDLAAKEQVPRILNVRDGKAAPETKTGPGGDIKASSGLQEPPAQRALRRD